MSDLTEHLPWGRKGAMPPSGPDGSEAGAGGALPEAVQALGVRVAGVNAQADREGSPPGEEMPQHARVAAHARVSPPPLPPTALPSAPFPLTRDRAPAPRKARRL